MAENIQIRFKCSEEMFLCCACVLCGEVGGAVSWGFGGCGLWWVVLDMQDFRCKVRLLWGSTSIPSATEPGVSGERFMITSHPVESMCLEGSAIGARILRLRCPRSS